MVTKKIIVDGKKLIEKINRLVLTLDNIPGNTMSYHEGGSDFYNPIAAGMTFQRIKDRFFELVELFPLKKNNRGYGIKYSLEEEET